MSDKRAKMPRAERAKQFMPFAAVRGLDDALAEKEREMMLTDMPKLSEESLERLDRRLSGLIKGDVVRIAYHRDGERRSVEGILSSIDTVRRELKIGDDAIAFGELLEIDKA